MFKKEPALAQPSLSRRRFLSFSGTAMVGLGAISAGLLPAASWAASLVGEHASQTLLRMARDIYPHDSLDDKYYAQVLQPLARSARNDEQLKAMLTEGVDELDRRARAMKSRPYIELTEEADRVEILRAIEDRPFFQRLKGDLMMGLYNNPELWPTFGYGGSAWEKGGYLYRGYNQIDWL
ncbi:twin-arginine translocation signal domain-containing protein [Marinobacterium stanieri]|uniref:Tat (Twin-arginine translocation) pathway signal sequence n=1 Tax=Marinobacterium stanieri TaxID=49186 RepID=A0A1N6NZT4_9GAMM|nr:twin-arginine translocation signal domain-containing protein [Marinobacterium stanieri]SIP97432.1 Tat (twin-arginine translocation) pathway signal sequence [Marinobacterium stanieri]